MDWQKLSNATDSKSGCYLALIIHAFYNIFCTLETERVFPCINIWQGSLIYLDDQRWGNIVFRNQCWYVSLKSRLFFGWKLGRGIYFSGGTLLHVSFSNTSLAHLSISPRSPPYLFKRLGLFALTTSVAILMTNSAILVPNAVFNFF